MENKNTTAAVITAIGKACADIVGAIAIAVFFCGPGILPWHKD